MELADVFDDRPVGVVDGVVELDQPIAHVGDGRIRVDGHGVASLVVVVELYVRRLPSRSYTVKERPSNAIKSKHETS